MFTYVYTVQAVHAALAS